jgi:enoyl-CoA hydratase/carnithine racemase
MVEGMPGSTLSEVLLSRSPGVVRATINRAHAKNSINEGVIAGLERALDTAEAEGASVMVVRGVGGTFCSGADLKHMKLLRERNDGSTDRFIARLAEVFRRFEHAPIATVAAIEGYAVAGGCEMLLACDIVLATTDAQIGDRHLEYALVPGAGGSIRLPRALSSARARYLLLTGDIIDGTQAEAWGLVTRAFTPDRFELGLEAVVERLRTRSAAAVATIKQMLDHTAELGIDEGIVIERELSSEYRRSSTDSERGLEAFHRRHGCQ